MSFENLFVLGFDFSAPDSNIESSSLPDPSRTLSLSSALSFESSGCTTSLLTSFAFSRSTSVVSLFSYLSPSSTSLTMTVPSLAPFLFPVPPSIFLLPRSGLSRLSTGELSHKNRVGSKSLALQPLHFTDGSGAACFGVAARVWCPVSMLLQNSKSQAHLQTLRAERAAKKKLKKLLSRHLEVRRGRDFEATPSRAARPTGPSQKLLLTVDSVGSLHNDDDEEEGDAFTSPVSTFGGGGRTNANTPIMAFVENVGKSFNQAVNRSSIKKTNNKGSTPSASTLSARLFGGLANTPRAATPRRPPPPPISSFAAPSTPVAFSRSNSGVGGGETVDYSASRTPKTPAHLLGAQSRRFAEHQRRQQERAMGGKRKTTGQDEDDEETSDEEDDDDEEEETGLKQPIKTYSDEVRRRGKEAFENMQADADVAFCERVYTLLGCREEDAAMMLGVLKRMVEKELDDMWKEFRKSETDENANRDKVNVFQRQVLVASGATQKRTQEEYYECQVPTGALEEHLSAEQRANDARRDFLSIVQSDVVVPTRYQRCSEPKNEYLVRSRPRKVIEFSLPHSVALAGSAPLTYPLPLPSVTLEWGVASLLLSLGGESLLRLIHLLLLERSVMLIGEDGGKVSACACALVSLLKPFTWAGTFVPLLPDDMTEFVMSPVPFVVGMVKANAAGDNLLGKESVKLAVADGLTLVDLDKSSARVACEDELEQILPVASELVISLGALHCRLGATSGGALDNLGIFAEGGVDKDERLTIKRVREAVRKHLTALGGDIAVGRNRWQKYGMLNRSTGDFEFYPKWFMEPLRAELKFKDMLVHTQLFVSFVDGKRREDLAAVKDGGGAAAVFIAQWIFFNWIHKVRKQKATRSFVSPFAGAGK